MRAGMPRRGGGGGQKWQPKSAAVASPASGPETPFEDSGVRDRGHRNLNQTQDVQVVAPTRPKYYQAVEGADALSNIYLNCAPDAAMEVGQPAYEAKTSEDAVAQLRVLAKECQ